MDQSLVNVCLRAPLCSAVCLCLPMQPTVPELITGCLGSFTLPSGKGWIELAVSPKITLKPDSSADGLDRTLRSMNFSDNRTCVHSWVGSWVSYQTDHLLLSQVLHRAPS